MRRRLFFARQPEIAAAGGADSVAGAVSPKPQPPATQRKRKGQVDRPALDRLPSDPGLCARCAHLELQASQRSVFVRCGLSDTDPRFPRYPRLPVVVCAGYRPDAP